MRSMMLGDCLHYASPYMRGVKQAMSILGHEHVELSIRAGARDIDQRIRDWKPDVLWTHMLLWAPPGSPAVADLVEIVELAARAGSRVVIHDGDAKQATRHPHDISSWCALALVNHAYDRSAWKVPVLRWPYFAMHQAEIVHPVEAMRCELFFAGSAGGGIYAARTRLLDEIRARGVDVRTPPAGENTIDNTPAIAASADAVLGFGRPEVPGWCDTRLFQYPGAGGILVHDDAQGYLEPWEHFVPYESSNAESVVEALRALRLLTDRERRAMRESAFSHVQKHHSSVARVRLVINALGVA